MLCMTVLSTPFAGLLLSQSDAQAESQGPGRIAVMPLTKGKYGTSLPETVDAPLFQLSLEGDEVAEDADRLLTESVFREMERIHGTTVIPLDRSIGAYFRAPRDDLKDTLRTMAHKTGEALGADMVMTGFVWRYKDRVGGDRAASSPASVGFTLILFQAAQSRILWSERYEETQQALSENILNAKAFFDRGGKWLTADELAREGLRKILKNYPYR